MTYEISNVDRQMKKISFLFWKTNLKKSVLRIWKKGANMKIKKGAPELLLVRGSSAYASAGKGFGVICRLQIARLWELSVPINL